MTAFAEFLYVAIALYLWESALWLPLRGIILRKRVFTAQWKVLDPRAVFTTRELGLIPMLPIPADFGLAPCQAPPLAIHGDGGFLFEQEPNHYFFCKSLIWNDLHHETPRISICGQSTRISSPRCLDPLRRGKRRGETPSVAVRKAWQQALSPYRAGREWKRWYLVSRTLRWNGLILMLGFFAALPLVYLVQGVTHTLILALGLWCLMAWTGAHLWWLGKKVYPSARSNLRMDAILAFLVPFHAMRASEIASIHAMATTHPVGLLLSSHDLENPWLCGFVRRLIYPLPNDVGFSTGLLPILTKSLSYMGKHPQDYNIPPDHAKDPSATSYCPRCHGLYLDHVQVCPDCQGFELRKFE